MPSSTAWFGALACFLLGAASGLLFTVMHRAGWSLGTVSIPIGLLLGLLGTGLLLIGIRLLAESRLTVAAAALGQVAAVTVLAAGGSGGAVIVADGPQGWAWMIGVGLVCAGTVVWPRRRLTGGRDTMESSRDG